jgi:hypothetical protein
MSDDEHPLADDLEAYSMGQCAADDLERIETHLLLWERCRSVLLETDEYLRAMKRAVRICRPDTRTRGA